MHGADLFAFQDRFIHGESAVEFVEPSLNFFARQIFEERLGGNCVLRRPRNSEEHVSRKDIPRSRAVGIFGGKRGALDIVVRVRHCPLSVNEIRRSILLGKVIKYGIFVFRRERLGIRVLRQIAQIRKRFDILLRIYAEIAVHHNISSVLAEKGHCAERRGQSRHVVHADTAVILFVRRILCILRNFFAVFKQFVPIGWNPLLFGNPHFPQYIGVVLQTDNSRTHRYRIERVVHRNVRASAFEHVRKFALVERGKHVVFRKISHIRFADHYIHRHFSAGIIITDITLLLFEESVPPTVFNEIERDIRIFDRKPLYELFGEQSLVIKLRAFRFAAQKGSVIVTQRRRRLYSQRDRFIHIHLAANRIIPALITGRSLAASRRRKHHRRAYRADRNR